MSKSNLILPKGFSPNFHKRMERSLLEKAALEAQQIPQLPPQLAQQISAGIALAMQGKLSNIQVGSWAWYPRQRQHVRVLIFRDEMSEQMKIGSVNGQPIGPGNKGMAEQHGPDKEYEVETTEKAAKQGEPK